jgi:hypothetical protein
MDALAIKNSGEIRSAMVWQGGIRGVQPRASIHLLPLEWLSGISSPQCNQTSLLLKDKIKTNFKEVKGSFRLGSRQRRSSKTAGIHGLGLAGSQPVDTGHIS